MFFVFFYSILPLFKKNHDLQAAQSAELPPELKEASKPAIEAMRHYEDALAAAAVKSIETEVCQENEEKYDDHGDQGRGRCLCLDVPQAVIRFFFFVF